MAVLDNKFRLRGSAGDYAYRVVRGKNIFQSKPGKGGVKQTQATKESASEFGVASNSARMIRKALYPAIQGFGDWAMVSRFTSKVLKAICSNRKDERGQRDLHGADLTYLNNFQFNTNSPLQNHLLVQPTVILNENRELRVQLPAFNPLKELKVPPLYSETLIRIVVAALNFREKYHQYIGYHEVRIEREKKAQEALDWLCPKQLPAGCVTLVSMSLHYNHDSPLTGMVTRNSKELMPSAIIGAFEIGKDEEVPGEKKEAEAREETAEEKTGKHATQFPLYTKDPMSGYWGNEKIRDMTRLREKQEVKDRQEKEKGWIVVGKI